MSTTAAPTVPHDEAALHVSPQTYVVVFVALIVLMFLTIGAALIDLGPANFLVAMGIATVAQLVQKPKRRRKGKPVPKKLHPLLAVLLIALGLALVIAGVMWRVASQEPARR